VVVVFHFILVGVTSETISAASLEDFVKIVKIFSAAKHIVAGSLP
jgi:hypothetical protein